MNFSERFSFSSFVASLFLVLFSLCITLSVSAEDSASIDSADSFSESSVSEYPPYLTFTGEGSDFTLSANLSYASGTLEYSTDSVNWTVWDGAAVSSSDQLLYIRGSGNKSLREAKFSLSAPAACSGNVAVLLDYQSPPTSISQWRAFYALFQDCVNLTSAPDFIFTSLSDYSCQYAFAGCSSLRTPPLLPATTLAPFCYHSMFLNCSSLQFAPDLPATSASLLCYYAMFENCTSLAYAKGLHLLDLSEIPVGHMFAGCTNLLYIESLPIFYTSGKYINYSSYVDSKFSTMFLGCTSLMSLPNFVIYGVPRGDPLFSSCSNLIISKRSSAFSPYKTFNISNPNNVINEPLIFSSSTLSGIVEYRSPVTYYMPAYDFSDLAPFSITLAGDQLIISCSDSSLTEYWIYIGDSRHFVVSRSGDSVFVDLPSYISSSGTYNIRVRPVSGNTVSLSSSTVSYTYDNSISFSVGSSSFTSTRGSTWRQFIEGTSWPLDGITLSIDGSVITFSTEDAFYIVDQAEPDDPLVNGSTYQLSLQWSLTRFSVVLDGNSLPFSVSSGTSWLTWLSETSFPVNGFTFYEDSDFIYMTDGICKWSVGVSPADTIEKKNYDALRLYSPSPDIFISDDDLLTVVYSGDDVTLWSLYVDGIFHSSFSYTGHASSFDLSSLSLSPGSYDIAVAGYVSQTRITTLSSSLSFSFYFLTSGTWYSSTLAPWPSDLSSFDLSFSAAGFSFSSMSSSLYLVTGGQAVYYDDSVVFSFGPLDRDKGWFSDSYSQIFLSATQRVSASVYHWFTNSFRFLSSAAPSYSTTINIYDHTGSSLLQTYVFSGSIAPSVSMEVSSSGVYFRSDSTEYYWIFPHESFGLSYLSDSKTLSFPVGSSASLSVPALYDSVFEFSLCSAFSFSADVYDQNGKFLGSFSYSAFPLPEMTIQLSSSGVVFSYWDAAQYIGKEISCSDYIPAVVKISPDGNALDLDLDACFKLYSGALYDDYHVALYLYPAADGNYHAGIIGWFERIWYGFISIPDKIGQLLYDLFVPDSNRLAIIVETATASISEQVGIPEFDFTTLTDSSLEFEDVEGDYEIPGLGTFSIKFIDSKFLIQAVEYLRPIIRGFLIILLYFFHRAQFMLFINQHPGFAGSGSSGGSSGGKSTDLVVQPGQGRF